MDDFHPNEISMFLGNWYKYVFNIYNFDQITDLAVTCVWIKDNRVTDSSYPNSGLVVSLG